MDLGRIGEHKKLYGLETQHFHVVISTDGNHDVYFDVIYEEPDDAAIDYFNIVEQMLPGHITFEEMEYAYDAFMGLAIDSTVDESNAFLGLQAGPISLLLSDCYGCAPTHNN